MKILILEDDFTCRFVLHKLLATYGDCHIAVQGTEAVAAFQAGLNTGEPYDLVCLDIVVPKLNGQEVLKAMRAAEEKLGIYSGQGATIIMTTSLDDIKNVMEAYAELCDGYLAKPISKATLQQTLRELNLIGPEQCVPALE